LLRVHRGAILCWPVSAGIWPKNPADSGEANRPKCAKRGVSMNFFERVSSVPHPTLTTVD
jgi:hypothetical protein